MDNFNLYLGNLIKDIRKSKRLSQDEFCNLLNNKITRSNLSKIELGKISTSAELIRDISITFNISPYIILNISHDNNNILDKYNLLDDRDKSNIINMINVFLDNSKNRNLCHSKNIEEGENKKSS